MNAAFSHVNVTYLSCKRGVFITCISSVSLDGRRCREYICINQIESGGGMKNSTKRPAVIVKHRAKLVERLTSEKRNETMSADIEYSVSQISQSIEEEEKRAYYDFICRLLARMDVKSLRRMMDAAINEI